MKADIIGEDGFLPWLGLALLDKPLVRPAEPLILRASIFMRATNPKSHVSRTSAVKSKLLEAPRHCSDWSRITSE